MNFNFFHSGTPIFIFACTLSYLPACMVLLSSEYYKYRKNTQKCSKKTLTFFVLSARLGSAQDRGNSRPGNLIAVQPRRSRSSVRRADTKGKKARSTYSPSSILVDEHFAIILLLLHRNTTTSS